MARKRSLGRDVAALLQRDPGRFCAYCCTHLAMPFGEVTIDEARVTGWELWVHTEEEPLWQLAEGYADLHRDHVHPRAKGGADELDNMVLACARCNVSKGATPLLLFLAFRAGVPRFRTVGSTPAVEFVRGWAA